MSAPRHRTDKTLKERVLDAIRREPGATAMELAEILGVPARVDSVTAAAVEHVLAGKVERHGLVKAKQARYWIKGTCDLKPGDIIHMTNSGRTPVRFGEVGDGH